MVRADSPTRAETLEVVPLPGLLGTALPFDPAWCLVADSDDDRSRVAESLLCLANGTIGSRGVLEGDAVDQVAPVMAAGIYESAPVVGEHPMPVPSWLDLPLSPAIPTGRRVLDLRDGLLTREVDEGGVVLRSCRFVCLDQPGAGVVTVEVTPGVLAGISPVDQPAFDLVARLSALGGGVTLATSTAVRSADGTPGGTACIERFAAYAVSATTAPTDEEVTGAIAQMRHVGAPGLLARQRTLWMRRWDDADIEIVGDIDATRALRLSLFHLTGAALRRGESAISARGLTGPAYAGHVFWDCEIFVLPVLAATDGASARAALAYRIHRLDPARTRAASEGRSGARFPWESARTGDDVTPTTGTTQDGETVPIRTGALEEHVTAGVAWAAWRYASWHGGWPFLEGPGRPLVIETARYWASRIRVDDQGRSHIDHVTGPDEYHEDVDDDTFTNMMARWNLRQAAVLSERTGGDPEEADCWRSGADSLVDNYSPATGRYEQFAGYDQLEPLLATDIGTPPLAADLIIGRERLGRSQIIKQADVLMAHLLIPDDMAPGSLAPNLDHYLPRTAHGSSLSPAVHAALLARAGRPDEALDLFALAAAIDIDDLTGTTAGGLHLANLGGLWQAVVHGFIGLSVTSPDDRALILAPVLPESWKEIRVRVRWRGRRIRLACRSDRVHVSCDRPVTVEVHGMPAQIEPPGRWVG